MSSKFVARYPGRCPVCRERIEVGDDLVATDGGDVVHFDCDGERKTLTPREVCPRCFMEKSVSGDCACEVPQ